MTTDRPHVALIIETSKAFGRGLLRGVSKYVRAHGPWSIYVDERAAGDPPPTWLRDWEGHGVIVRAQSRELACVPGDYPAYYAGVRDTIRGVGPNPVTAAEVIRVIGLLGKFITGARQRKDGLLAVVHIHLAAISFQIKLLHVRDL